MEIGRASRRGVSGIIAALVIFGLLFVVGSGYFLNVSESNLAYDNASGSRLDALQQQHAENLVVGVALKGASTLVVSVGNSGGIPTAISDLYLVTGGKTVSPPGLIGQALNGSLISHTNVTAAQWPLALGIGASTASMSGCVSGKAGCQVKIEGYSYSPGSTVYVNVVTGRGNTFTGQYPPKVAAMGVSTSALVVSMTATPTPPLTQVFSCSGCVTLTITIYNFANNPVTGVALSPAVPGATVSGTATIDNGACKLVSSSSNIPAYSGSGNAPSIQYSCTYDSNTGAVGGYASFSGVAVGTLNGVLVSSAEAVSNNLQIGANSNAITQGAFSINFFFFKSSSCYQTSGGNWAVPCKIRPSTFPPASPNSLPDAANFSVGHNYYVAFYVNVTNNYPAPLELLQYTFLQFDSSYFNPSQPNVVGSETDFWLAGSSSSYNTFSRYYPSYTSLPTPTLATNTGNLDPKNPSNCIETSSNNWAPSPNCIDISTGHTVTLTFAACGFGSSSWDWGMNQYATNFDPLSSGCDSSAPNWSTGGVASVLTVVISYVYQGQIYTQAIQFQGQSLVAP